jgi:2-succinyl-6-hydroxy-2,4-cyclohexadiene-1-carboxylate synthase
MTTEMMVDGARVDVHPGKGAPMLLMHGFLSSRAQWRANLTALAAVCTPVTVELLGHGRSESPKDPRAYRAAAYLDRFEAVRIMLGAERWFVCGQSFGAGLTLRYSLDYPERVVGQVFTNSLSGVMPTRGTAEAREAQASDIEARGQTALEHMDHYPRPALRLPEAHWRGILDDASLLSPPGVAQGVRVTIPELSVAERLSEIAVPTLLVNGRRETRFQPVRDDLAREIPGVEIVDLDGGHSINIAKPEGFNAAVTEFVTRLS